jgi:antitoxin (DNA-binding transcriptional repressor) of toxin-antitoxin stability system
MAVVVRRPDGQFATLVDITGYDRPVVRLTPIPGAYARQSAIRECWLAGQ